jgi:hypothetical protein
MGKTFEIMVSTRDQQGPGKGRKGEASLGTSEGALYAKSGKLGNCHGQICARYHARRLGSHGQRTCTGSCVSVEIERNTKRVKYPLGR